MSDYQYSFPERDVFRAMEVTEPEFNIFEPGREDLYVPLQGLRSPKQFLRIKKELGIHQDKLAHIPNDFLKILFSGHRGCGKTVELLRFQKEIHTPDQYFAVFVSLMDEIEINRFQPEDLYFILINKLLCELRAQDVPFDEDEFEEIATEWIKSAEVKEEISKKNGIDAAAQTKGGFNFWSFFSAEGSLKALYGYENKTTETIRSSIRRNPDRLITRLNEALRGVRLALRDHNKGEELIFIVDDFEKTRPEVYDAVFLKDTKFVLDMAAHLICCVPIQTFYQVQNQAAADLFKTSYLPMIRLEKDINNEFAKIITQRVEPSLFDDGILEQIIQLSGGSPRQLLRIVNQCLLDTDNRVDQAIFDETKKRLEVERIRPLTESHRKLLNDKRFDDVSSDLLELLFALNVMEYNGDAIERKINPILADYFK